VRRYGPNSSANIAEEVLLHDAPRKLEAHPVKLEAHPVELEGYLLEMVDFSQGECVKGRFVRVGQAVYFGGFFTPGEEGAANS
jgi:hypothetical protein